MNQEWTVAITNQEREFLMELFESAENEMIHGIDHADLREYRARLQRRLQVLESLRAKIDKTAA
jgi:hypothetical protein